MAVLAQESPFKARLGVGTWLQPLLFFTADAAAGGDLLLAARAMDGFAAAAISGGRRIALDISASNVLPLTAQLWRTADDVLRRSLMTAVAAAVRAGALPPSLFPSIMP